MSETMHDEQTPLKNLNFKLVVWIFFPLVVNVDKRNAEWFGVALLPAATEGSALVLKGTSGWETTMSTVPRKK